MFLVGVAIALGIIIGVVLVVRFQSSPRLKRKSAEQFDLAMAQETDSKVGRLLIGASRQLSGLPYVNLDEESPGYKALRYKIAASGGLFAGSVTVFLSVQVAAAISAAILIALAMFSGFTGVILAGMVVVALGLAYWPYQRLTSTAKKRFAQVNQSLPEFAELLLMPMTSGYGILPSLSFTAERVDNIVAREVRIMLQVIGSRAMGEEQAFTEAGARLGTPAAIAFFNTLSQAYIQGTEATSLIRGQAVQLRKLAYEETRGKLKLLPTKLVLVIGVFLMIPLFIVTLVPVGLQLMNSLGSG